MKSIRFATWRGKFLYFRMFFLPQVPWVLGLESTEMAVPSRPGSRYSFCHLDSVAAQVFLLAVLRVWTLTCMSPPRAWAVGLQEATGVQRPSWNRPARAPWVSPWEMTAQAKSSLRPRHKVLLPCMSLATKAETGFSVELPPCLSAACSLTPPDKWCLLEILEIHILTREIKK